MLAADAKPTSASGLYGKRMTATNWASTPVAVSEGRSCAVPTGLFIANEFVPAVSGKTFATVNPATGKEIVQVAEADTADVNKAVLAAKTAFDTTWKNTAPYERGRLLNRLADLIERDFEVLADIEALDNGKAVKVARVVDLPKSISCLRYYAGFADKLHGKVMDISPEMHAYTRREPIGVVGQIIPWNFPLLMLAWKWGPAIAAGNTIVMKTSEKTPLTALYVCRLVVEAGFPAGVINVLSGYGPTAGNAVSSHMDIRKLAFTGSTAVGRLVMAAAARSNLKKVSLELGGKSPSIVFADADLDAAVKWTSVGIFFNHGQCCCAGSRVFVHEAVYDEFLRRFRAHAQEIRVGNQLDHSTDAGPLVDSIQFSRVMGYIEKGKSEGATVELGGERLGSEGFFVPPTVFSGVVDEMVIAKEEIFGPVACLLKFSTEDEVVKRANSTDYGLAASIHTTNVNIATRMAARLDAGTVWINCHNVLSEQVPFGGFKQSGIGRELGEEALCEYTEVKSVIMNLE